MTVGVEKLLQWLKEYTAITKLEGNLSLRNYMARFGEYFEDYESKSLSVTFEEKEQLMELILRQSEVLMLYHLFLNNSCSELKEKQLMLRAELPGLEGSDTKDGNQKQEVVQYELPAWAREELRLVQEEKILETSDEEASLFLSPLLKLPKMLRKDETCRRLEKGKKRMIAYLKMMKDVHSADIVLPTPDLLSEKTPEAMKTMLLNNRKEMVNHQFLRIFPELESESPGGREQSKDLAVNCKKNIYEALSRVEEEKRQEGKMDLEENILNMESKLRAYEQFLNTTEEVVCVDEATQFLKFEVPDGMTDINPDFFKIVDGRPISKPIFKKQEYLGVIKKNFLNSLITSFTADKSAMAEQQNIRHIDYLLKVLDEIDYFTEAFTIYLFENQEDSMVNARAFLDIGQMLMSKEAEIVESQQILSVLKSSLYSLGGLLKFRRLCQTLLYELAPYVWRTKYLEEKEKLKGQAEEMADYTLAQLAMFKLNIPIQQPTLDKLVIFLADTVRTLGPPASYFTNGFQIDLAIRNMELENLYSFQHLALLITRKEEQENAKKELIKSCQCEIDKMEIIIDKMKKQLYSKVKEIRITDQRSQNILNKYWRVVMTNQPLFEAITLIKAMFDEFIGETTDNPLEMLDILTEEIVKTQMELCELPTNVTREIRAFILEKESLNTEMLEKDQKDYDSVSRLLKTMRRSWELSAGQQGHPFRFRSHPISHLNNSDGMENLKRENPLSQRMIKRIMQVFEPTDQEDVLLDTLATLDSMREDRSDGWILGKREAGSDSEESQGNSGSEDITD